MERIGLRWVAAAAALTVLVAASPANASAGASAAIQIFPLASAMVQMDDPQTGAGCSVSVVVPTSAFFSEGVRVVDVTVAWEGGGPAGKADQHRHPSKVTEDSFTFTWPVAGFKPGDYKAVVRWQAHNGNGLSMATQSVRTRAMTVRPDPSIVKLGTETKCEMQKELTKLVNRALSLREHADAISEGCPKCAAYLESVAAGDDSLADIAASLILDPPDPNFTSLPTAVVPVMPDVQAGGGVSAAVATAFGDLLAAQAQGDGQARAVLSAIEKAQGAKLAGNTEWENKQSLAAAGFLNGYATQLERLGTVSETLAGHMAAGGFANPTADRAGTQALANKLRKDELPPVSGFPNWYKDQAKLTDDRLEQITTRYVLAAAQFGNPRTLQDTLTDPTFKDALRSAAASLRANASALTANPSLNYAGATASPRPTVAPKPTATPPATQASLVNNGGFDAKAIAVGSSYATLTAGKQTLDGWRLECGSIDVVSTGGGIAATGNQFVDLSGNDTAAGMGVIAQDITVTPGRTYRLSFKLAGNPNGPPQIKTVEVTAGGAKKTFTFDTKGRNNNDLGWVTHTIDFGSCSTSKVTVRFASLTEGSRGPNIDDIIVTDMGGTTCLPIPLWLIMLAAGLLLAGLAAILYLKWRARRRRVEQAEQPVATQTEPEAIDSTQPAAP